MAKKETEGEALNPQQEKLKALQAAMSKIEKDFGKGSIMRMGDEQIEQVDVIPTGSIALNAAFLAANSKGAVTNTLVLAAVRDEMRKIDHPINESEFRWLKADEATP